MSNDIAIHQTSNQATLVEIRRQPERFPRLNRVSFQEAMVRMNAVIHMAAMYKRNDLKPDEISFMSHALLTELLDEQKYGAKYLSFEEIARVIKRAILEQDIYLSTASLYRVIIEYIKSEGHEADRQAKQKPEVRNIALEAKIGAETMTMLTTNKIEQHDGNIIQFDNADAADRGCTV